jgi:hypothetical protein
MDPAVFLRFYGCVHTWSSDEDKNYLIAVEVCLSKTLATEACQNVPTCGATVVEATPQ